MNSFGNFKVRNNQNYVYHSYRMYHPVLCVYDAGIVYPDKDYRHTRDMSFKSYLFEYIVSGRGWIEYGGRRYSVSAGDCVYISRDCEVSYGSDPEEPYTKLWLNTDGALTGKLCEAAGFDGDVFVCRKNLYERFQHLLNILETDGFELERISKHLVGIVLSMFTGSADDAEEEASETARIRAYIDTVLMQAPTVRSISEHFGICEATVIRKFKKEYGRTPNEYIRSQRMKTAESMLRNTDYSVSKIALLLNFCSQSYFSEQFHEYFGAYPTEYRKNIQNNAENKRQFKD